MSIRIRQAGMSDSISLARLSAQLGYPVSVQDLAGNMRIILCDSEQQLWVAELNGRVEGWLHAGIRFTLESAPYAEIIGLIVDENHRGKGLGKTLTASALHWARARGVEKLRLRTNTIRKEAHQFYEKLGFTQTKEQKVYDFIFEDHPL